MDDGDAMGWEQLEQPRAAVNAHQPQRPFGALFATSPLHVPCRNGAEERKSRVVCSVLRGTQPPYICG